MYLLITTIETTDAVIFRKGITEVIRELAQQAREFFVSKVIRIVYSLIETTVMDGYALASETKPISMDRRLELTRKYWILSKT